MRVSFFTQGCRTNQSETASLKQLFLREGFRIVPFEKTADIIVINTCTVTDKSDSDLRKIVSSLSRKYEKAAIALIGCSAETKKKELLAMPGVKWVAGNSDKMHLPYIIKNLNTPLSAPIPPPADPELTRANVKIHEGCSSFCSYCIVPYTRGKPQSRKAPDILREIRDLLDLGYMEIVLTGINIGKYECGKLKLPDLINEITSINRDFRLRLSSVEPGPELEKIIPIIKINSKICRFLHIPLQSGSAEILKKMGRKYTCGYFSELILHAATNIPQICLGTDIITGFPGEKENHFSETFRFIQNLPLSYFHVFSYSDRPPAKSSDFDGKIPPSVIKERSKILRTLGNIKRRNFLMSLAGTSQNVLFEEKKNGYWHGLTDNYARVMMSSAENLANKIIRVKLSTVTGQTIKGMPYEK